MIFKTHPNTAGVSMGNSPGSRQATALQLRTGKEEGNQHRKIQSTVWKVRGITGPRHTVLL